jgi:hypothetical protein
VQFECYYFFSRVFSQRQAKKNKCRPVSDATVSTQNRITFGTQLALSSLMITFTILALMLLAALYCVWWVTEFLSEDLLRSSLQEIEHVDASAS